MRNVSFKLYVSSFLGLHIWQRRFIMKLASWTKPSHAHLSRVQTILLHQFYSCYDSLATSGSLPSPLLWKSSKYFHYVIIYFRPYLLFYRTQIALLDLRNYSRSNQLRLIVPDVVSMRNAGVKDIRCWNNCKINQLINFNCIVGASAALHYLSTESLKSLLSSRNQPGQVTMFIFLKQVPSPLLRNALYRYTFWLVNSWLIVDKESWHIQVLSSLDALILAIWL